jgi:hypothetical protein
MKLERLIAFYSGLHLLMMFEVLPDWVRAATMGGWALGIIAIERGRPWSGRLMQVFAGIGFVSTFLFVRPVFGIENSACLAAWVLAFQIHHLEKPRARLTQLFVCVFALAIFLVNQASTFNLFVMLVDLIVYFALLNASQGSRQAFGWQTLKSAGRLMLLSFPIWILIFFLFPRFTLSLWGNEGGVTAQSGFADEIRPGMISKVTQKDDVAFRFRYQVLPDQNIFYFRGMVLNNIKGGLHWSRGGTQTFPVDDGAGAEYGFVHEVWLEPRWSRNLFTGEFAQSVTAESGFQTRDIESLGASVYQLRFSPRRLTHYQISSTSVDLIQNLSVAERQATTELPEEVLADVRRIRELPALGKLNGSQAVEKLSLWFRDQEFRYSQTVPPVAGEKLSVFLNENKVGFCEHYASAAAILLRSAGIPARVVVGFLGGTYNPIAASYTMLDRDAHAWLEFYDESASRWMRYDPTAVIQPLRISLGSEIYRLSEAELNDAISGQRSDSLWTRFSEQTGLIWDAWAHEIERRIVFYDASWLNRLYEQWGIPEWGPWLTGGFAMMCGGILLMFLKRFLLQRAPRSGSEKLLQEMRRTFRIPDDLQGEEKTFQLLLAKDGEWSVSLRKLKDRLLQHRYGPPKGRPPLRELRDHWQGLQRQMTKDGTLLQVRESVALELVRQNISHDAVPQQPLPVEVKSSDAAR